MCKLCFSICVSCTFPPFYLFLSYPCLSGFVCHYYILLLLTCFLLKDRKCMDMVGRDGGEYTGGLRGGETVIRINCIKYFLMRKKRKIIRDHMSSCGHRNRPSKLLRAYIHQRQ